MSTSSRKYVLYRMGYNIENTRAFPQKTVSPKLHDCLCKEFLPGVPGSLLSTCTEF